MQVRRLANVMAAALAFAAIATVASAQVISSPGGNYAAGVTSTGNLYESGVGLSRGGAFGFDPIAPGTPRESWGVSASGFAGYSDPSYFSVINLAANGAPVYGANTAFTSTFLTDGITNFLQIDQTFSWSAENVLKIAISVTNLDSVSHAALFSRDVDWDMPLSFVNVSNVDALVSPLIDSSFFGFESPDPTAAYGLPAGAGGGVFGPGDLGGGMHIDLGVLLAGGSATFDIYHALNTEGQSEAALRAQLYGLGATFAITATDPADTGNLYVAAMAFGPGERVQDVPEPGTLAMLAGIGIAGFAVIRRRK